MEYFRKLAKVIHRGLQFGGELGRERPLSAHIPYVRHVNGETIRLKEDLLMKVIKLDGYCFQTADQSEINLRLVSRNTLVRALNDSRFALYQHVIRREAEIDIGGDFDNPFSAALEREHMRVLADRKMYVNDLYLTVMRRDFQGKVGLIDNAMQSALRWLGIGSAQTHAESRNEAQRELDEAVANMVTALASYGARVLQLASRPLHPHVDGVTAGLFSEPCEFLAQIINGASPIQMALPRMPLDGYLPTRQVLFGRKRFEIRGPSESDTRFGAVLSVKEYPHYSGPGMLDALQKIAGEMIISQSFSIADRAPVLSEMARVERQIAASDEKETEVQEGMTIARNEVVTGRAVFGYHHLTVVPLGRSIQLMEKCVQGVTAAMQDIGMILIREDLNMQAAFFAQLPGNFPYIARRSLISSPNFCGFASNHNYAVGRKDGNHWGPAISLLQTTSSTPYYFNFHRRQVGNSTVVGPTGSGKTVALSFLMAQSQRIRPRPRLVYFDKDRGANVFIRAMGGRYEVLRPGEATGFNPLQLPGSATDREFVLNLLRFIVRARDGSMLGAAQEAILQTVVEQVFDEPQFSRRFSDIGVLLKGRERAGHDDLFARFESWIRTRAWLFDNPHDLWSEGNGVAGFDMTAVLDDDEVRTPAMMYIFHRVEALLDGRPTLIFIDEAWRYLLDPTFSAFINDKLKTIRKLNGVLIVGTQSAKDLQDAPIAHTLIEQTSTNIFFPNPKADEASYIDGFKLTRAQFNWVRETDPVSRQFLIKHDHDSVIATLDLGPLPWAPRVLSSTPDRIEEMESAIERHGDQPEQWLPHYCGEHITAQLAEA